MSTEFTDDNIEQIQQYLKGALSEKKRIAFERAIEKDNELKQLVEHYQIMKEGFELKELMERRKQLEMIQSLAAEAPNELDLPAGASRPFKMIAMRNIMSYAAILIVGVSLGWLLFQQSDRTKQGNLFAGNSGEEIVLFDAPVNLIRVGLKDEILSKDTSELDLIISKMPEPKLRYQLLDGGIEIILDQREMSSNVLGGAAVDLIIQQFDEPPIKTGLLKIDQLLFQIPFTNEDFEKLFN